MASLEDGLKNLKISEDESLRDVLNKAIESGGLSLRTDKNGKSQYILQVTGHDCAAKRGRCKFFKFFEKTEPYAFPEDEIIHRWFQTGGGASSGGGLTEGAEFIIDTVYDKELKMDIP